MDARRKGTEVSSLLYAVCIICLAAHLLGAALCLRRLGIGPDVGDRAIALDTLTMVFIGIVSILCMLWSSTLYFDAVWILTLVGYLGSAAIALYLEKGRIF
jgi:multisubunit Na+/H+ antiporter MnhF subunit